MIKMVSRKNTKGLPDFSCTDGRMWVYGCYYYAPEYYSVIWRSISAFIFNSSREITNLPWQRFVQCQDGGKAVVQKRCYYHLHYTWQALSNT